MEIDKRITDLKTDFTKVIDLKNENVKMFETLEGKIKQLKIIYSEFIKSSKNNLFIFGLDSFHFQSKLIDIEYDDMKRLYAAITNRIYCEYFKLYKIVVDYIIENIKDDRKIVDLVNVNISTYPIYKDLEPFKQYEFEIIQNVHENIITLLNSIYNYLLNKEHDLKQHQIKNASGLNIDNFVNTFNFNNVILREKLLLFITYIEFFHKLHTKYFTRFTTKMQLFMSQIMHDIKFEDSVEAHKMKRKSMMETLINDNIDKNILNELKQSMNDIPTTPTMSVSNYSDTETIELKIDSKRENSLQGIFLSIDENKEDIIGENKENKENKHDNDDMSTLTVESQDKMEESNSSQSEVKVKRKYTPRKKKNNT
jgi:hypothetical protein